MDLVVAGVDRVASKSKGGAGVPGGAGKNAHVVTVVSPEVVEKNAQVTLLWLSSPGDGGTWRRGGLFAAESNGKSRGAAEGDPSHNIK